MFFIPNLRRGISVIGIVMAIGLPWLVAQSFDKVFPPPPGLIAVPAELLVCTSNKDCGAVETSCSSCCHQEAINISFEKEYYDEHYQPGCVFYDGAVCDCVPGYIEPVCMKGRCKLAPPPPVYNE